MASLTAHQTVELFHLLFVRALYARVPDKTLLAIKGGINLRFFFQSVRLSEDLDIDVVTMAKGTLENHVDRILASPTLVSPLRTKGIEIQDISKPKQTELVQKWKLGVAIGGATPERTQIEFSRRSGAAETRFDAVDSAVAKVYGVPIFPATHYPVAQAVRQKIHALMDRREPQPRDVFDLHLLFARPDAPTTLDAEAKAWIPRAIVNADGLSYDDYLSLVVAYLEPDHAETYSSRGSWDTARTDVVRRMEALK